MIPEESILAFGCLRCEMLVLCWGALWETGSRHSDSWESQRRAEPPTSRSKHLGSTRAREVELGSGGGRSLQGSNGRYPRLKVSVRGTSNCPSPAHAKKDPWWGPTGPSVPPLGTGDRPVDREGPLVPPSRLTLPSGRSVRRQSTRLPPPLRLHSTSPRHASSRRSAPVRPARWPPLSLT